MLNNKVKDIIRPNIIKYRKLRSYTQEKLAEVIGVDEKTISKIERGRHFPSEENINKIAQALNISVDKLFEIKRSASIENLQDDFMSRYDLIKDNPEKMSVLCSFIKALT